MMANLSDEDLKIKPPIGGDKSQPGVAPFVHSFSNEAAVVMNELLITDSPNHSKPQIVH